jgi:protein involved in temperature-dependent protein secretion
LDYGYSRSANPRTALEEALASIENGARGLAFHRDTATDCLMRSFKRVTEIITHGRFVWWDLSDVYSNIQPFRHQGFTTLI